MRRRLGLIAILALSVLPACAAASQSATPRPSFLQNCEPWSGPASPALTCDRAITAALASLSPSHPPIVKVEFHYGSPCDPTASCPVIGSDRGYVIIEMAAADSDEWIATVRNSDGSVTAGPAVAATPTLSLPTLASDIQVCEGVHAGGTLAGSPTDPRVAWLVDPNGGRRELVWPPGFTARFDPDLAVLDASGKVVYREGDTIDGGCVGGGEGSPLLVWPSGQ